MASSRIVRLVFLSAALLWNLPTQAFGEIPQPTISGHLKYQTSGVRVASSSIQEQLGPQHYLVDELDLRGNLELRHEQFQFVTAAELLARAGNSLDVERQLSSASPFSGSSDILPNDDRRLVPLTTELLDGEDAISVLRLDRLFLSWSEESTVVKLGRQSISWGNGISFQVLDIFNPFSPTEIDRDYKPGDDMLYAQWLAPGGGDLQSLYVARRDPESSSVRATEGSLAVKWRDTLDGLGVEYHLLAARHYDEEFYGASLSRDVARGVLRADVSLTQTRATEDQRTHTPISYLINYDRTWNLFDYNVYGFLEYYRNGFGSGDGEYSNLESALLERVGRGELFSLGRDYLTLGNMIELTPLLQSFTNAIFNLHDESGIFQQRFEYEAAQDISILLGTTLGFGPRGSEFKSLELGSEAALLSRPESVYLRVSYFY